MTAQAPEIIKKYVRCGFHTCDLGTDYCEPAQQECVQCSSICHSGAEIHQEECKTYCGIYLQNLDIRKRLQEMAQTTSQPIINVTTEVIPLIGGSTEREDTADWIMLSWIIGICSLLIGIFVIGLLGFWCARRWKIPRQRPQRDPEKAEVDGSMTRAERDQDEEEFRMGDVHGGAGSAAPLLSPAEGAPEPKDTDERLPRGIPQEAVAAAEPSDEASAAGTLTPGGADEKLTSNVPERGKTEGGRDIYHPTDAHNATTARAEDVPAPQPQTTNSAQQVPLSTTETEPTVDLADVPEEGQPGRIRRWVHSCPSEVSTITSIHAPTASVGHGQMPSFQPASSLNLQSDVSYFSESVSRPPSVIQRPHERERLPSGSG